VAALGGKQPVQMKAPATAENVLAAMGRGRET
jgi:hypothetical protein